MTTVTLHEYLKKIDSLIDENRLDEAIAHCHYILEKYPRFIPAYRLMGKAYVEKYYFDEAADLFQRVLSAEPNDLISHIALFEVYKEKKRPEQALWHLERAFEIDPYNEALREELRQLYVEKYDDLPYRLPLTPGAAAHLYLKGEMYQQAVQLLQPALAAEPDRVDLEVMLAEALWQGRDDQRIDAEEVCLNILEKLPDCIAANAILSTIWLRTGRMNESQKYLARIKSLTCLDSASLDEETAVGRAFLTDGAPELPDEITLPLLEIEPEAAPQAKPSADWVSEVTFDAAAPPAEQDAPDVVLEGESGMHSYDWMIDLEEEPASPEDELAADMADEDTDWFAGAAQDVAEEVAGESGVLPDGVLGAMAFSLLDSDTTSLGEDEAEKSEPPETDWFLEETAAPREDMPAWLAEETNDLEQMAQAAAQKGADEPPDWLDDTAADNLPPIQMTQSEADEWVFAGDSPDDLPPPDTETEIMGQVKPEAESDDDWLSELAGSQEPDEDIFSAAAETPQPDATEEDDEAWLAALGLDEPETTTPETETAASGEEDWLSQFDTLETTADLPDTATVEDDWLAALEDADEDAAPLELDSNWLTPPGEEPPTLSDKVTAAAAAKGLTGLFDPDDAAETEAATGATEEDTEEDLEDWLSALADEGIETGDLDLPGEAETAVEEELLPDEAETDDWLSVLSGEELAETPAESETDSPAAIEIGELTPEELAGTDYDEIPDWLMTGPLPPDGAETTPDDLSSGEADAALSMDALTAATGETEEFPDWLEDLPDQPEDEEDVYADLGVDSDILPGWMVAEETDTEQTIAAEAEAETEKPQEAELSGLLASLDTAADGAAEAEELPDWLQETPQTETEEAALPEEDWLTEPAGSPSTETGTERESDEDAGAAGQSLAAGLAALDITGDESQPGEPAPEEMQWLDQLAEEEDVLSGLELSGADGLDWLAEPLEEPGEAETILPALEAEPPPAEAEIDIGQDREAADVDDALSWLEDLAAQQETPVEELPSIAQDALADDLAESETTTPAVDAEIAPAGMDWLDKLAGESGEPAVTEEDTFTEMEAELDDAMSWLDEIAADQPAPGAEEGETAAADPELAAALAALARQVEAEGLLAGMTITQSQTVSDAELVKALDWLEAQAKTAETAGAAAGDLVDEIDLFDMPDDPDAAVAWLEAMAAGDEALDIEMEPAPIKASEDAVYVVEGTVAARPEAEEKEEKQITETAAPASEEEIDIFDMPDDPDAAIAWLEAMAAGDEALEIEMEPAPIKASEDAVYVVEGTVKTEPEAEAEIEPPAAAETETTAAQAAQPETGPDDLLDIPDDPDEALAWFEAMAASDEALEIEMEPAPIKASEDAVYVVEGTVRDAPEAGAEAEAEGEAEAEKPAAPAETEEAAGWLDALETQPETGPATAETADVPDWMVAEADISDDLLAEAELLALDEIVADEDESGLLDEEAPFEAPIEQDVSEAMPAWFALDANDPVDEGQTGWLRALPEVDVDSWLVAEEEATSQAVEELEILPETDNLGLPSDDTGELRLPGDTGLLSLDDEDFMVVEPDSAVAYNIDKETLAAATAALADGRYQEAADKFQELVAAGGGMMILIAELETAVANHPDQPAFRRALGDAYMRNGQLQKALETYRMALDSL